MANQAKVSRFPRIDAPEGEASFVLLHVSHTGSHPLDVKLIGTESSEAYVVSCKVVRGSTSPVLVPPLDSNLMR